MRNIFNYTYAFSFYNSHHPAMAMYSPTPRDVFQDHDGTIFSLRFAAAIAEINNTDDLLALSPADRKIGIDASSAMLSSLIDAFVHICVHDLPTQHELDHLELQIQKITLQCVSNLPYPH